MREIPGINSSRPGVHQAANKEDKVACFVTLQSAVAEADPQPEPPAAFVQPRRVARLVRDLLRQSLTSTVTAQVGALLSRKAFNDFKKRLDYSEYGGAPLLGIRGVCIVNHGSSNDRAIYNGIRVTAEFAQAGINQQLEQEFACRRPADYAASQPGLSVPVQPLH